jgi:hypothetical protein
LRYDVRRPTARYGDAGDAAQAGWVLLAPEGGSGLIRPMRDTDVAAVLRQYRHAVNLSVDGGGGNRGAGVQAVAVEGDTQQGPGVGGGTAELADPSAVDANGQLTPSWTSDIDSR